MAVCLKLTNANTCVRVDDETAEWARGMSWHLHKGYAAVTRGSGKSAKRLYLHRMLKEAGDRAVVDHINGNKLDNRQSNLRIASVSQNGANVGKLSTNKSGLKGVVEHGDGRYRAYIHKDRKTKYLGTFDNAKEAACEYDKEARKLFGEFAKINGLKCKAG